MSTTIAANTLTATLANAVRARFPRFSETDDPTANAAKWLCAEIELRDAKLSGDIDFISSAIDGYRAKSLVANKTELCATLVDAALAWSEQEDSVESVDARTSQTLLTTLAKLAAGR